MTRKTLTGLLLAASTLTAGSLAVVNAQDDDAAKAAQQQADLEAAVAAALGEAEKPHDHEHKPTSVHSGDKHFLLDDETAYPDPDGFASMFERISYAIGRGDAMRLPGADDLNTKSLGEGIDKGLVEEDEDYALGYSQGFELARQFVDQRGDDLDIEAFVKGIAAALKEDDSDRSIGYLIGNSFREAEIDLQAKDYVNGIEETLALANAPEPKEGEDKPEPPKTKLTEEQVQETLGAFQAYLQEKQKQDAIKAGTDYIDSLKEEDGWKKTESGIAYRVTEAGDGKSPDANDICKMDYELRLLDGDKPGDILQTTFDTDQTVDFSADRVIEGWGEVLQLMKVGDTFETVIPYNLGYKEMGSPPSIPPYATLVFKMKMHSFEAVEDEPEEKAEEKAEEKPAEKPAE